VRNRGIGRARLFMGALLLLATVVTWGIGLMMNPHGETVAKGTEYVRTTIVTFKRNGAIGTLILSALAAWLLFPRRRPKWPERDWALIALLVLLSGSSIYTLIRLPASAANTINDDGNLTANVDWNLTGPTADTTTINAAPPPDSSQLVVERSIPVVVAQANDRGESGRVAETNVTEEQADSMEEQADAENNPGLNNGVDEPADEGSDENQE